LGVHVHFFNYKSTHQPDEPYFLTFSADDKGIVKYVTLLSSLIFGIATAMLLIGSKYSQICGKYMNKFCNYSASF
jgi:hypothetical protein